MPRLTLTPSQGNPIVAVLLVTLYEFKFKKEIELSAMPASDFSVDEISLSFSNKEAALECFNQISHYGAYQSAENPAVIVIRPAYNIVDNAIQAFYQAVGSHRNNLVSVDRLVLGFPSEEKMNELIQDIKYYIEKRFGSDALCMNAE
jgi:hypothetical protein